jgi:hypothetical protein
MTGSNLSRAVEVVAAAATEFCRPVAATTRMKPKLTSLPLTETQIRLIEDNDADEDANQFCTQQYYQPKLNSIFEPKNHALSCNVELINLFTSVTALIDTSSMSSLGSFVVKC